MISKEAVTQVNWRWKRVVSTAIDFVPIVGNVKGGFEFVFGFDPITGRKLDTWERAVSGAAILGGPLVKGVKHGAKFGGKAIEGISKGLEELSNVGRKFVNKVKENFGKAVEKVSSGLKSLGAKVGDIKVPVKVNVVSIRTDTGYSVPEIHVETKPIKELVQKFSGKGTTKGTGNLTRKEALNKAKDLAGVPRSQQPTRQWQVGDDITKKGADYKNFEYSSNPTHHGRYYKFDTPQGKRVIVEHTNDGRPHTHAGKPKEGANPFEYDFKKERYSNIYGPNGDHHIYYDK